MNKKTAIRIVGMLAAVALMLSGSYAIAQTITGTVVGTVTDQSGAVVAGASVTARNNSTGVTTATVTNQLGLYNIRFLPIGSYTITVTGAGFQTTSIGPFALDIDQTAKIDAKLQVGNTSTTVSVSSEVSPLLQTQDATIESTLSGNTLSTLPMNGLNYQFATLFVPGAVDPSLSSMASKDGNERAVDWYGSPSFNGARAQTNNYVLDGVEINETTNNLSAYNPAPDAIEEMRVITADANAEYGNVNGGEVLVVTKGGTNQYHGSVYEFFQDNAMEANSWANGQSNPVIPLAASTQNQFGATIGGPLKKNKLFLFGDYLGFRYHSGGLAAETVPTAKMRTCTPNGGVTTCDFSELLTIPTFKNIQLYNNQNGQGFANATPYANNQIPLVNPAAKFLFANPDILPMPNAVSSLGVPDIYEGFTKSQTVNNQGDVRVDYKASEQDALMGRYTIGDAYDFYPRTAAPVFFQSNNDYPFQSFVTNWVHTFSPSLVNEFRTGFTREVWNQGVPSDPSGKFGKNGDSKLGLPFTNQPFPGFTQMVFSSNETNVGSYAIVTQFHENNFYYGDNLTWQRGLHTINFGAQILRYQQNVYYAGNDGALGHFNYTGQYTENGKSPGYGYADFVLDEATSASIGGVSGDNGQRQYRNAFYVQDDWRLRPNLTMNIGLRYAHDQPIYEVNNKEDTVDTSNLSNLPGTLEFAGKDGNSRALYDPYYLEFMPRLGFAWQTSPSFVVHGGYGITDDLEGTGVNLRMSENYPFQSSFVASNAPPTATSSGPKPLLLENGFTEGSGNLKGVVASGNFSAWQKNLKPAMVQQFNLAVQYLIDKNTSAQLGYVGELGQHLVIPGEMNQWSTPATGNLANGDCSGTIAPAAPACNLVGNNGNFRYTMSEGYSNYNAMQATIHHRNANGLEFTFNYTWSKAMTNNAGFYGVAGVSEASSFLQDIHNPHADYGPAGQDTRNAFNGYWTYQLPFGRGQRFGTNMNRALDEAVGGWKLSGSVVMYSGFPLTIRSSEYYYVNQFFEHSTHFRPLHVAHRTVQHWFGTDPSATPCKQHDANGNTIDNGTCAYGVESYNGFGNTSNGSERAPGYRQVDLSAFKAFKVTESQTLELRGDAFNALNIASYAPPASSNVTSTLFGRITGTNSTQRVMQVSLHYRF